MESNSYTLVTLVNLQRKFQRNLQQRAIWAKNMQLYDLLAQDIFKSSMMGFKRPMLVNLSNKFPFGGQGQGQFGPVLCNLV